jgi:hypothetical protein
MSAGIEKLINNSVEHKLDRKILMSLINFEEKDAEEIHLAIKQITASKLDDSNDKSPFRMLLPTKSLRNTPVTLIGE